MCTNIFSDLTMLINNDILLHFHKSQFSMLLEQESDRRKVINRDNFTPGINWMLAVGHLLSNAYTSTIYSDLTKDPGPLDMPKSFEEVLLKPYTYFVHGQNILFGNAFSSCFRSYPPPFFIESEPKTYAQKIVNLTGKLSISLPVRSLLQTLEQHDSFHCRDQTFSKTQEKFTDFL